MPIELLATLVPLGIALVVLVVKFSGISTTARLESEMHAISQFSLDYPAEKTSGEALLTANSNAALIGLKKSDAIALIEVIGDRFLTRLIKPSEVKSVQLSGSKVQVRFADFTHPGAIYQFENSVQAENASRWLQPIAHKPG